ncbi:MAG: hypothetical protein GY751_24090 [Bacteroidetes bacterium]|nr:hypothetical protein [Bacteroidota bacterium]
MLMTFQSTAQQDDAKTSISIGFFGHGIIRPGIKIGADIPLKQWHSNALDQERSGLRKTLFISPQLGTYSRFNFYSGILTNVEIGMHLQRDSRKFYSTYSIGVGYLAHFEVNSITVNFDGDITDKKRELRNFALPSASVMLGWDIGKRSSVFTGLKYGMQLSPNWERSGQFFFECGFRLHLNKGMKGTPKTQSSL